MNLLLNFDNFVTVAPIMAKMAFLLKIPLIISDHIKAFFGATLQPLPDFYSEFPSLA